MGQLRSKLFSKKTLTISLLSILALALVSLSSLPPRRWLDGSLKRKNYYKIHQEGWRQQLTNTPFPLLATGDYIQTKQAIKKQHLKMAAAYQNNTVSKTDLLQIASDSIEYWLVNKLIPHWYDTPWSFNGHCTAPQSGKIACGYFCATLLQDCYFNINRYKTAIKGPEDHCKVVQTTDVCNIKSRSYQHFEKQFKKQFPKNGIYVIGFGERHVGFLYYKNNTLFLLHSIKKGVFAEKAEDSYVLAFQLRNIFIAELSTNHTLLENWLNRTPLNTKD